ncbi:alpha/beta hydrolase-fold protein [Asticcacaulis sp. SL142]|uniref:alpha/beta hydrolase n=1 Tax=Asticcacaulis sp. SL142 TaxID=2995155 RepID=UPI00226CE911|nr:alpha/beta hydrolase-fold protein [Asticcacaulis sp. SL142]WAC49580.1 alpha/beta hydrolase-fold protein [Asticcacaulis sp. SL142]
MRSYSHHAFSRRAALAMVMSTAAFPTRAAPSGRVVDEILSSAHFAHNLIGISPDRRVSIYLPPSYGTGRKRYPVIYYLHTFFEDHRTVFDQHGVQTLLETAFERGDMGEAILVSADFSTPVVHSIYTNSSITGNWEDFLVQELVSYIDANYRTLAEPAARGLTGAHMGGYGAIRIAGRYGGVFGSVYAMHPVGTGHGVYIMQGRPNWDLLAQAKALNDVKTDPFSQIFTAIYQAHLPSPDKGPLYIDMPARRVNGELIIDPALTERLTNSFFLERQVASGAQNLKGLRGFKLDWGRSDSNIDHVYSNQSYALKLNEYGIPNEAEEYNGGWGDKHWGPRGRFVSDVLPFFKSHLSV